MAITIERFVEKLEKLKEEMDTGKLKHGEYDMRLARIISELRDQKLDAGRGQLTSTIDELLSRGVITPSVKTHLLKRLGID
jgi:hypothetical protein